MDKPGSLFDFFWFGLWIVDRGRDDTSSQVYIEMMASNHFPVMQDVPQRL